MGKLDVDYGTERRNAHKFPRYTFHNYAPIITLSLIRNKVESYQGGYHVNQTKSARVERG